jgi:hypothetical protein
VKSMRSWRGTFTDPSTSPAHYAKALFIDCSEILPGIDGPTTPLAPFHGFSPIIKRLRMIVRALPSSEILNLIFSFPLLEDLSVVVPYEPLTDIDDSEGDEIPIATQPSTPPMTGFLELYLQGGMGPITRQLLSLPGGIHFRKLFWAWLYEEDLSVMALVEACSHTLESVDITSCFDCTPIQHLSPHR